MLVDVNAKKTEMEIEKSKTAIPQKRPKLPPLLRKYRV
jgi:hypothetical protein